MCISACTRRSVGVQKDSMQASTYTAMVPLLRRESGGGGFISDALLRVPWKDYGNRNTNSEGAGAEGCMASQPPPTSRVARWAVVT